MESNLSQHNDFVIDIYVKMAKYLAIVLNKDYEIVVHKIIGDTISIACIENSEVTGRSIDSPITDLALKLINESDYKENDYKVNYKGVTKDKNLKSSTLYIKNQYGELIGLMCINYDYNKSMKVVDDFYLQIRNFLNISDDDHNLLSSNHESLDVDIENLGQSIEEVINTVISQCLEELNIPVERLNTSEKISIIDKLNHNNVFKIKGAVNHVAAQLKISAATTYRYITKLK